MNPYKFDEPICIAFSGGESSAFMTDNIIKAGLPEGSVIAFCNTAKEREETLIFVRDCGKYWNVPIVWLEYDLDENGNATFKIVSFETASRNGEPFEKLIKHRGYLPNVVRRFCTVELKIRIASKYCKSIGLDISEEESIVGFRYDEPRRVARLKDKSRAPMYLAKHSKQDVRMFWDYAMDFKLNLPFINGATRHGNCDLCFLKNENIIYSLIKEEPSRAIWWANQEKYAKTINPTQTGSVFSLDRPSYQQMLDNVKNQVDWVNEIETESIPCFCGD